MNYFKIIRSGLALGLSLMMTGGYALAETAPLTAPVNQGQIVLSETESGGPDPDICTIPATVGRHPFGEVGGCFQDDNDLIMLKDVPSAMTITIHDDRGCRFNGHNWRIAITTVKNPTTTGKGVGNVLDDFIKFETIWDYPKGAVIVPGVIKEESWSYNGQKPDFTNGASCLDVRRK